MCVHSSIRVERRIRVCTRDRRYPKITNVVVIPIRLATKTHRPTKADCPLGLRRFAFATRKTVRGYRTKSKEASSRSRNCDECLCVRQSRVTLMFMLARWTNLCLLMADYRCYTWCDELSLFVSNVSPSTRSRTTAAAGYFARRNDSRGGGSPLPLPLRVAATADMVVSSSSPPPPPPLLLLLAAAAVYQSQ